MSTVRFRLNAEEGTLSIAAEDKGVFLTVTGPELDIIMGQLSKMRPMMNSYLPMTLDHFPAVRQPHYAS